MGSYKLICHTAFILILVTLGIPASLAAQSSAGQQPEPPQINRPEQQGETIPKDIAEKMAKERLKDRYASLRRDSEKLLELATELKQYVDKSGDNVMSLEVIRKCDQIEKLSKSVRTKMKGD